MYSDKPFTLFDLFHVISAFIILDYVYWCEIY